MPQPRCCGRNDRLQHVKKAIVRIFFLIPGVVCGIASGSVKTHRDIIAGMSKSMSGMGYCIVMAFFCAQFIYAFGQSNLGGLIAVKGAEALKRMQLPMGLTLFGIILLTASVICWWARRPRNGA